MLLGRYGEAEHSFGQAVDLAPRNSSLLLNLADCQLLDDKTERAAEHYHQVLKLLEDDPAAAGLEGLLVEAQARAHLETKREAVTAIQTALRMAPDNPQVTYTAALVYALVGDRQSALANAEHAFHGGMDARWFAFPWFDSLRDDTWFSRHLPRAWESRNPR
jgi:serine/threonine-protein kinase